MPGILYGSIPPRHPPSPPPSSNPTDPPPKIPEAKYGTYAGGVKGTFPHTKATPTPPNANSANPHVKYNWNSTQHTSAYETPQLDGAYTSFPEPETWYLAEDFLPDEVVGSHKGDDGRKGAGRKWDANGEGGVVKGEGKGGGGGSGGGGSGGGDRDEEAEEGREWTPVTGCRDPRFIKKP